MEREVLAYILLALLVVSVGAWIFWSWHHSHKRSNQRRMRRENAEHREVMAEKDRRRSEDSG